MTDSPSTSPQNVQDGAPDDDEGGQPLELARIDQSNTFTGADPQGVCAGVCYVWARHLRHGRLNHFAEAFTGQDTAPDVLQQVIATSDEINARLRAVQAELQTIRAANDNRKTQIRQVQDANAALAAQLQGPPGPPHKELNEKLAAGIAELTGLTEEANRAVQQAAERTDELIRQATLDPFDADAIALTDGPATFTATIVNDFTNRLASHTGAPVTEFIQLYGTAGSSHLIGYAINAGGWYFLDPNTSLFQVRDAGQLVSLFQYSWDTLYAEDYVRYRFRRTR